MITGPAAAAEHSGRDAKLAVYAVFIANDSRWPAGHHAFPRCAMGWE
jgi:hypothetical protein